MNLEGNKTTTHVTVVFWDGFDAMNAIGALARSGFSTQEILALGVLAGSAPDLEQALLELGISQSESALFKQLFDEGAIVLVVRAQHKQRRKIAARLLEQCGGLSASNTAFD